MSTVTVESGSGDGFVAGVTSEGRLTVDAGEISRVAQVGTVQTVIDPVTTRPEAMNATMFAVPAQVGVSTPIVNQRPGRRWLEIQNLDPNNHVHIRIGGGAATVADRRLGPFEVYSWRNGVSHDGEVQAIAVGAPVPLVVTEFWTT